MPIISPARTKRGGVKGDVDTSSGWLRISRWMCKGEK